MFSIQVFIENEAHSNRKNLFHEKTLAYQETVTVTGEYPYPYGFILNTAGGDADNLDCFVLTRKSLKSGQIVECEPIAVLEQTESSWDHPDIQEEDNTILARLKAEEEEVPLDAALAARLADFITHIFDHLPGKKVTVGSLLGREEAVAQIRQCMDRFQRSRDREA
jgi:inorganic pyrophosphatase